MYRRETACRPQVWVNARSHTLEEYGQKVSSRTASHILYHSGSTLLTCLVDSWVEIASQPSSSSLSSATDEIVTTGLRVQSAVARRKRRLRSGAPSHLDIVRPASRAGEVSSQEEYEESESESDRVMTSSNEGLCIPFNQNRQPSSSEVGTDDEDENRTAVNYPIHNEHCFTPQPNAFSHPPTSQNTRTISENVPGSYFPGPNSRPLARPTSRHSYSGQQSRVQHSPYNMINPSHNAAADNDAALRASLTTLLSFGTAARGLTKSRQPQITTSSARPPNRMAPATLRLVPESALPEHASSPKPHLEPTFRPTIRRHSTSTSTSADGRPVNAAPKDGKRKSITARNSSKDHRMVKKPRRSSTSYNSEELFVSPTLLTWVVSAGVVVVLSALTFSAGYAVGKEAGRLEAGIPMATDSNTCAREAGRTSLGLRRLRFAVQA